MSKLKVKENQQPAFGVVVTLTRGHQIKIFKNNNLFSGKENYCTVSTSVHLGGGYVLYISQLKENMKKFFKKGKYRKKKGKAYITVN